MAAAEGGWLEAVRLLLGKGARVDVAHTAYNSTKHGQIALVKPTSTPPAPDWSHAKRQKQC